MTDQHTAALPEDATFAARASAAFQDGRETAEAFKAGDERVNPFAGADEDPRQRVLAQMWGRGFAVGNPMPRL